MSGGATTVEKDLAWLFGIVSGWEDAAEYVRDLSGERWMEGGPHSETAPVLWDVAEELVAKAKELRTEYDAKAAEARETEGEVVTGPEEEP